MCYWSYNFYTSTRLHENICDMRYVLFRPLDDFNISTIAKIILVLFWSHPCEWYQLHWLLWAGTLWTYMWIWHDFTLILSNALHVDRMHWSCYGMRFYIFTLPYQSLLPVFCMLRMLWSLQVIFLLCRIFYRNGFLVMIYDRIRSRKTVNTISLYVAVNEYIFKIVSCDLLTNYFLVGDNRPFDIYHQINMLW